ncbi:hypothetical protein VA7868_01370 [Vibrio aerogenes CECT 7868]|uniref:DUF4123 domain-containing protein n=1 Tax=Vibrio aerogenes CECT 7868 TaxID=1216006 RepID=A0A1M5XY46_9VIBR|nr:DUF4123 domain-containing protein [Vibrio aerogenes]SHI04745.1 hypothetical protein VA7868_01370 [Vibrio aerogenes CECT 7868]
MLKLKAEHQGQPVRWYALVSDAPDLRQQVYQWLDGHDCEPLYLSTPLEPLMAQSPLLITLKYGGGDALMTQLPPAYTLYFSAPDSLSADEVADQLRWRMLVYYHGQTRGLLHYYQPQIAGYFFSRTDDAVTSSWLGGLYSVVYYRQTLSEPQCWQEAGDYTSHPDQDIRVLQPSQEQALEVMFQEREIVQWAQHSRAPIDWPVQHAVTRFCHHHHIEEKALKYRLRNLSAKTGQPPVLTHTDETGFARLNEAEKVNQLESIALKGVSL